MEDYFPPEISLLSNYIWYYLCLKVPVSFFKYYLLLQEAFPNWLHWRIFCFLSVLTHHWSYNEWFACSSPCLAVSFLRRKKKKQGLVLSLPSVLTTHAYQWPIYLLLISHSRISFFNILNLLSNLLFLQNWWSFPLTLSCLYSPFVPSIEIYLLLVSTHSFKLLSNYSICASFISKTRS